ncbi:MAG TPA: carbon storage regulator [Pirellulales bacterium]|nr:carbon storage regulator [Pirellulales bacterium]
MLVLTRRTNQKIQIGENIVLTILQVRGQSVRIGIEAPRQLRVVRSEIADRPFEATKPEEPGEPNGSEACQPMSESETPASQLARPQNPTRRLRLPSNALAVQPQEPRRARTSSGYASPLADRVTAIVESSAVESCVVGPFPFRPFGGGRAERDYHFQAGRSSALTTQPSGQRP